MLYEEQSNYAEVIRNRRISSLTSHDFYVADMAAGLDMHFGIEYGSYLRREKWRGWGDGMWTG